MKRIAALFLLLLLMVNLAGVFPVYLAIQSTIKHEMREKIHALIPKKDLHEFRFKTLNGKISDKDFIARGDHEFSYKDNLYDVVKKETSGAGVIFRCLEDKEETQLTNRFANILKKETDDSRGQSRAQLITKLISMVYLPTQNIVAPAQTNTAESIFSFSASFYKSLNLEKETPPPQALV